MPECHEKEVRESTYIDYSYKINSEVISTNKVRILQELWGEIDSTRYFNKDEVESNTAVLSAVYNIIFDR